MSYIHAFLLFIDVMSNICQMSSWMGFVECDALWVKCFFLLQDEEENGRIEPVGRADTCLEHMGVRSLE